MRAGGEAVSVTSVDGPITHVNAERVGPNELVVTWRGAVDVIAFVSDSPDDAGTRIIDLDGPRMLSLTIDDCADRPYVHLFAPEHGFVVAAERRVPLDGAFNFRDIGGYHTADGRQVRWGRVFRSDHLADLTDDDRATLGQLGVKVVADFRGAHELRVAPSALPDDGSIVRIELPIGDGSVEGVPLHALIVNKTIDHFTVEDMTKLYIEMLGEHGDVFAQIAVAAADSDRHALVYHCTAGKDRTGLATALLLSMLGVDLATILDDYELTNRYRSRHRVEELRPELHAQGIDIDKFLPLFTAQRRVMADALTATVTEYGSLEQYVVAVGGLDPAVPAALRDQLLTRVDGLVS